MENVFTRAEGVKILALVQTTLIIQLKKFASDYNDVLFSNCTERAHILKDVQSASCDAAP
jgi:hypothetical protein